jgi:uncharacterized protein YfcZ (UPF0381/DUF406 family)
LLPRSGTETTASEEAEKPEEEEAVAEEKPKLSDDVIARRSKSTIEEYFSLRDKKVRLMQTFTYLCQSEILI